MFLEKDEEEKVIEYLSKNKSNIKDLLAELTKEKNNLIKTYDSSFHEDIETEYIQIARMIIAQDIGKNTALPADSILYTLECLGTKKFKEYLK